MYREWNSATPIYRSSGSRQHTQSRDGSPPGSAALNGTVGLSSRPTKQLSMHPITLSRIILHANATQTGIIVANSHPKRDHLCSAALTVPVTGL